MQAIRATLLDHGGSVAALVTNTSDDQPPEIDELRGELADVMAAYQASRYGDMLMGLPEVLSAAHLTVARSDGDGDGWYDAQRVLALASQAAAMVLTKLGELDLAWTAADRGFLAAQRSGDRAVLGSLCRSVVYTLQSHGRTDAATRLADKTADDLRRHLAPTSQHGASVYGTLLLAGAMASARAGDRQGTDDYLEEADLYARQVGRDANHLWTAFGPTNVAIHRVATSVALGDMDAADRHTPGIDATRLPLERRVRYAFDLARIRIERREIDRAVDAMLTAERLAPEQVHHHLMGREIVADLRHQTREERSAELTQLAQRVQAADYMALGSAR
ncbi:MAG: helix-turn-helix domain-containing protein [Acidimicrobiales bacterium]